MSRHSEDEEENYSETSSVVGGNTGSVISTVPDRHGFLGGSQYTPELKQNIPPSIILKREQKWLNMINNWDKMMDKHYKKVRERCRKGIPQSLRSRAWPYLCRGKMLMDGNKDLYNHLRCQEGNPRWIEDIRKDLHRQFPYHEMFVHQQGHGQKDLFDILKAYSIFNPDVGYCQAQAPVVAFLLMHIPAEQAFWCFVALCDKYLIGYYSQGMEAIQVDGDILFALLKKYAPNIHKHLEKQKVEPILYMTEWFLCVFTRTLPWPALLRVWDMFLCEGIKIIFKVALILIKLSLGDKSLSALKKRYPTMYETLEALRNPPLHLLDEDQLVDRILRLNNITEEDFGNEHKRQVLKRRANNNQSINTR